MITIKIEIDEWEYGYPPEKYLRGALSNAEQRASYSDPYEKLFWDSEISVEKDEE